MSTTVIDQAAKIQKKYSEIFGPDNEPIIEQRRVNKVYLDIFPEVEIIDSVEQTATVSHEESITLSHEELALYKKLIIKHHKSWLRQQTKRLVARGEILVEKCALGSDECKGRLHVHHTQYKNDPNKVLILCQSHHNKIHKMEIPQVLSFEEAREAAVLREKRVRR